MNHAITQKGQSLVEILFAIAIFTIGVVTIGYLIFDSFASLSQSQKAIKAQLFASEGIEAVKLMQDEDFTILSPGTYGLSLEAGVWELTAQEEEMESFTRRVIISDIEDEIKEVVVEVAWVTRGVENVIRLATHIANWEQTGGEAGNMEFDVNDAQMGAFSTSLTGAAVRNVGEDLLLIRSLSVQYGEEVSLTGVRIGGSAVLAASSTISSGEEMDIEDYVLMPGAGFYLFEFDFDGSPGDHFIVTAIMSDGSKKHVSIAL